jgi:hypothetical protein
VVLAPLFFCAGCNLGARQSSSARPLQIVEQEPTAAEGLDCDGGDCAFATNGPLRFRFDRWLTPSTAVRQSLSLYTEGTNLGVFLRPDYDVTARVLSVRPDAPLAPDTVYILQLANADQEPNGFGFRAYDGNSLAETLTLAFRTASASEPSPPAGALESPTCSEILAAFARAGCASVSCHGGQAPRMGLSLDSASGLRSTATDQVAHETQSGPEMTQQVVSGGRFGTQMPVIDSSRPENSYLMYKLLIGTWLNREIDAFASSGDSFAPKGLLPSEVEEARAWFIEFGAMPPDSIGYPDGVSPLEFVTSVQRWIRSGAECQ